MLGTIKFVDQSVDDRSARILDHCDVIASRSEVRRATERSWTPNWVWVIHSSSFGIKHKPTRGLNSWGHIRQIQQVSWCHSISTNVLGGTMLTGFPENKMAVAVVQWEICGTIIRENIANLRVSSYNGEWLRQKPSYAWVLTASFALLPRVLDEQHPRSPVIIP